MIFVPDELKTFAATFPVPLFLVGGYVRDALCGKISDDIDVCSSLPVSDVVEHLKNTPFTVSLIKKDTGTVSVKSGKTLWQYTSFRTDLYDRGHSPVSTRPASMHEDALRRDFKANAVYYDINKEAIVDPLDGVKDIENRILSTTRTPKEVFSEDGLRLMRLARLSSETGFTVDDGTLTGARENAEKIVEISPERIRTELERILLSPVPSVGLELLFKEGVLSLILPEIADGYGMPQRKDFHKYDVFYHTLATVDAADISVRTAALFHDVGKPERYKQTGSYHGHDVSGAELCEQIMTRLRYPKSTIQETKRLVLYHMLDLKGDMRENKVRRFVQKNADLIKKLCLLKDADMIGCGYVKEGRSPASVRLANTLEDLKKEGVPFSLKQLLVRGDDLPEEIVPKNRRQDALLSLLSACADVGSPLTTKEKQLQYILNNYKG